MTQAIDVVAKPVTRETGPIPPLTGRQLMELQEAKRTTAREFVQAHLLDTYMLPKDSTYNKAKRDVQGQITDTSINEHGTRYVHLSPLAADDVYFANDWVPFDVLVLVKSITPWSKRSPEERLTMVLKSEQQHIDDIATAAGMSCAETNATMVLLELKGIARRNPGNMFALVATLTVTRIGDFYEAFDDDARTVARVCNMVLTPARDGRDLCGIPAHAIDRYKADLYRAGYRVELIETA